MMFIPMIALADVSNTNQDATDYQCVGAAISARMTSLFTASEQYGETVSSAVQVRDAAILVAKNESDFSVRRQLLSSAINQFKQAIRDAKAIRNQTVANIRTTYEDAIVLCSNPVPTR